MSIVEIIQICSAGFILAIGVVTFLFWAKFVVTGKHVKASLNGWPAFVWFVATNICAVTTLANVN